MKTTNLLYLEQTGFTAQATVLEVIPEGEQMKIVLDSTIFYPQGGGQPSDCGEIVSTGGTFAVQSVRFVDGVVYHFGKFTAGRFEPGQIVTCTIDKEARQLHSRLHSAGHLIDFAVRQLGFSWKPTKGYHFVEGPYVEYEGDLAGIDSEKLQKSIEQMCNDEIKKGIESRAFLVTIDELKKLCGSVPDYIPANKPVRVVAFGKFYVPCGGTHVARLDEIGSVTVRKIKAKGGVIRVSYSVL